MSEQTSFVLGKGLNTDREEHDQLYLDSVMDSNYKIFQENAQI